MPPKQNKKPYEIYACPHICPHKYMNLKGEGPDNDGKNPLSWCFLQAASGGNLGRHTDASGRHPFCSDECRHQMGTRKSRDATDTEIKTWLPWLSSLSAHDEDKRRWFDEYGQRNPRYKPYIFTVPLHDIIPPLFSVFTDGRTGIPTDSSWEQRYNQATLLPANPPPPVVTALPGWILEQKKDFGHRCCFIVSNQFRIGAERGRSHYAAVQNMLEVHYWTTERLHVVANQEFLDLMNGVDVNGLFCAADMRDGTEIREYHMYEWVSANK